MASTYTSSLQIQKIGTGEQSGIWGNTTNTNWDLIEQAVAGVQTVTMVNADYTLTVVNGASDEARNAVLLVGGTNSAIRKIVIPAVTKVYVVFNNTAGGYAITVGTSSGAVATIPNGVATLVFCDATNTYSGVSGSSGNFNVVGNTTVGGALSVTGASTLSGATTLSGGGTSTTPTVGDNTTKIATTAFVTTAVTNATGSLGTMSTQNANAVAITGGTINSLSVTSLGTNAYNSKTVSTSTPSGGSDGDIWYQVN